jgi:hypothetical protein
MKKRLIYILFVLACGTQILQAEMRLWTDKKGNTLEAEFVKLMPGKVVLKTPTGKLFKVPQSGLSADDQTYLKNAIPPQIEIKVAISRKNKPLSKNYDSYNTRKAETIKGTINLTKKNREPCMWEMTAYLYVFCKKLDTKEIRVMIKSKKDFSFKTEKTFSFVSGEALIKYEKREYSNSGEEYKGYVLIVVDSKDNVLCTKGSRQLYESKASEILSAEVGTLFDSNLKPKKTD